MSYDRKRAPKEEKTSARGMTLHKAEKTNVNIAKGERGTKFKGAGKEGG